jgi:hypothetical protein
MVHASSKNYCGCSLEAAVFGMKVAGGWQASIAAFSFQTVF